MSPLNAFTQSFLNLFFVLLIKELMNPTMSSVSVLQITAVRTESLV